MSAGRVEDGLYTAGEPGDVTGIVHDDRSDVIGRGDGYLQIITGIDPLNHSCGVVEMCSKQPVNAPGPEG